MGFFAPTNNDFPDFEGKQTDLFVPNGTHAKSYPNNQIKDFLQ